MPSIQAGQDRIDSWPQSPYATLRQALAADLHRLRKTRCAMANALGIKVQAITNWLRADTIPPLRRATLFAWLGPKSNTEQYVQRERIANRPALHQAALDALREAIDTGRLTDADLVHLIAKCNGVAIGAQA